MGEMNLSSRRLPKNWCTWSIYFLDHPGSTNQKVILAFRYYIRILDRIEVPPSSGKCM